MSRWPFHRLVGVGFATAMVAMTSGCVTSRSLVDGSGAGTGAAVGPTPVTPVERPADPACDPTHAWTTGDCVAYAWQHNRSLALARWRVAGAQAAVDEADGELLPSLRATGSASTRSNDAAVSFAGTSFVTGDRAVASGGVLATLPLFGAPPSRRAGARQGLAGAQADRGQARADVAYAVARAVADLREARARVQLIAASTATLQEQARIATDRQGAGLVLATDALAGRVRLAEREQDRLHALSEAGVAQARLDRLLGLPLERELALADEPEAAPGAGDEPALAARALAQRQDLVAVRARRDQAAAQVREAEAGHLPSASLVGGYYATSDSLVLNRQWFGVGLDVAVPLLDNGAVAARVDAARARVGEQGAALDDLEDGVREEVHDALLALREATARLPVARQGRDLARQRLAQVQDQYRQGLADMTVVLDAENDGVAAQLQELRARLDCRRAADQLAHAAAAAPAGAPP